MYKDKLVIDEEKIKEKLKTTINNQADKINEYNLSEILFSPKTTSDLDADIQKITKSIQDIGFENTANIFSISNSSKFGGEIGWINENQLSKIVLGKTENSNPALVPGFILAAIVGGIAISQMFIILEYLKTDC